MSRMIGTFSVFWMTGTPSVSRMTGIPSAWRMRTVPIHSSGRRVMSAIPSVKTTARTPFFQTRMLTTLSLKMTQILSMTVCCNLGHFPFDRCGQSDQSVLKKNARVLRTGSGRNGPARGSEPLSSPAPVGQSAGIWRVVAGTMYARALDLSV